MSESPSMPRPMSEIEQLRLRVAELERENERLQGLGSAATEQVVDPPEEVVRHRTFRDRVRDWTLMPAVALTTMAMTSGLGHTPRRGGFLRRGRRVSTPPEPTISQVIREETTSPASSAGRRVEDDTTFVAQTSPIPGGGVRTEEVHHREGRVRGGRWKRELRGGWRPVAWDIGLLAVGAAVSYLAFRTGSDLWGIPEWARNDPNLYNELMNYPSIDIPTVGEILPDPNNIELYRDVKDIDPNITGDGLDNIFRDTELYRELQAMPSLSDEEIIAFFKDNPLYHTVRNLGLTAEEMGRIIDDKTNFEALIANNYLSPEAAAEALQYPEITDAIMRDGADAPIVRAIDAHEKLFVGLAEMDVPYAVIEDALRHPDAVDDILARLAEPDVTAQDIAQAASRAEEAPDFVMNPAAAIPLQPGDGATNALQHVVESTGDTLSGAEYWELHKALVDEHGADYLRGIGRYSIGGSPYDFGYAHTGTLTMEPGVYDDIVAYADQH